MPLTGMPVDGGAGECTVGTQVRITGSVGAANEPGWGLLDVGGGHLA
jgi:hypothetical protein